jgi:hypothetical protein
MEERMTPTDAQGAAPRCEHKDWCDYWIPIPEGGIAYPCSCHGFARPSPAASPGTPSEPTDELWCVIFKRDTEPVEYLEGPPADMLARYERLATSWTGVVLCKVLVPDASAAPMGEARARFNALRAALSSPTTHSTETTDDG